MFSCGKVEESVSLNDDEVQTPVVNQYTITFKSGLGGTIIGEGGSFVNIKKRRKRFKIAQI